MVFTFTSISNGASSQVVDKVVMVILNRCSLQQLESMPQIKHMIDNGYIGLMNTRVSGRNSEAKGYATIGWGTRAEASQDTSIFHNIDDNASKIYTRRTGDILPEEGIVNIDINMLKELNSRGDFNPAVGSLGHQLKESSLKTALIGNSDTDERKNRAAGYIAMDNKGYIDMGATDEGATVKDINRPYGVKTDFNGILSIYDKVQDKASFIVIETGDTNRLEDYKKNLTPKAYNGLSEITLNEIDNFVKELVNTIDFNKTMIMLVTPYPSDKSAEKGDRLTPVVFYFGGDEGGLLTSNTTRRKGIIANIDIAPSVLSYLNNNPIKNMTGREVELITSTDNLEYIKNLNNRVVNTSVQRYRVLYTFAIYQMLASVLALLAIIFRKKICNSKRELISLILLGTIIAPLVFLIMPIFGSNHILVTYLLLVTISTFMVLAISNLFKNSPISIIAFTTAITLFALLVDIFLGQALIKNSIMGYDPIIGARYYGIGNEYAGILIGCSLIFTTALIQKNSSYKRLVPILYFIIVIAIGLPLFGANVGATITATASFLFVGYRVFTNKCKIKNLAFIGVFVVLVVTIMALIDLFLLESKSHLAEAIKQILNGGPIVILDIITRKIAMNIRVMGVTIWSRVLLIAVAILGVLFYKPIGLFKRIAALYPQLAKGWSGIILACGIGFLVNDSGVVTAAMSIIYLTTTILYLLLNDIKAKDII